VKALNQDAVREEAKRIFFSNFKKLKVTSDSFWSRLKWKILGMGALICAMNHDNEILKEIGEGFRTLTEDVKRGYYHIEVTMDDAGINPLPCPLCKGEKNIVLRKNVVIETFSLGALLCDIFGKCPICNGSGYMPALTKGEKKLLREIEHL